MQKIAKKLVLVPASSTSRNKAIKEEKVLIYIPYIYYQYRLKKISIILQPC